MFVRYGNKRTETLDRPHSHNGEVDDACKDNDDDDGKTAEALQRERERG